MQPLSRHIVNIVLQLLVAGLSAFAPLAAMAQSTQPNIVYIVADDMGLGDVRCYTSVNGQAGVDSPVDTPNIDRLATAGMLFTNAHSPSAVCTPTRYGLLNGQYAWRTPLTTSAAHQSSGVLWAHDPAMITPERNTVAEMLQGQGYNTAVFGKWHLGNNWVTTDGQPAKEDGSNVDYSQPFTGGATDNGFDYYFGDDVINLAPYTFIENDMVISTPSYSQIGSLPEVTRRSMQYLINQSSATEPFFMYMSLSAPHSPIVPPVGGVPADPSIGMGAYTYDHAYDDYENFIRMVDWVVGELIDTVEDQGLASSTMIVFTADNGVSTDFTDNDGISPGFINGILLRGRKADAWEGGHRMPMLVRWDGHVAAGSTSDELVELTDFYATTTDMLGVAMPGNAGEDSFSYLDILEGTAGAKGRTVGLQTSQYGSHAIRQIDDTGNEWKLIFGVGGGGWLSGGWSTDPAIEIDAGYDFTQIQLYNLATDPGELTNLFSNGVSASELAKAQELQDLLQALLEPVTPTETLRFDFGHYSQTTANSAWNNVASTAALPTTPQSIPPGSVVSTTGATSYGLDASGYGSGPNHGASGPGANWDGDYPIGGSGLEGGVPGSDMALKDGLYARAGDVPSMQVTNLPPGSVWDFLFYGARGNDGGDATFIVTGATIGSDSIANVFQNATDTAAITGIVVPGNGTITFSLDGGADTDSASMNVLMMTASGSSSGPGTRYCPGDGDGAPCPCGNSNDGSVPDAGCANGVFASGARLTGTGAASISSDSLVLLCTGLEPNNSGLYFQADNDLSPGNIWGDGLQCAGGQLRRLGVRFSDANGYSDTSGYPTSISVKAGNVLVGDTKYYQCWYRNPTLSPCFSDFNASNGYAITWLP
jgi:arylsulfatase A